MAVSFAVTEERMPRLWVKRAPAPLAKKNRHAV